MCSLSYRTVSSILAFQIISFMILVPAGGAEVFFDVDMDKSDLSINPEIPDSEPESVDLTETFSDENVSFVDTSSYFNGSQEYNSSVSVVVEEGTGSGNVVYNFPNKERVDLTSSTCGFLISTSGVSVDFLDSQGNSVESSVVCGKSSFNIPDSAQFVRVDLDSEEDSVLYDVSVADNPDISGFGSIIVWSQTIVSFPVNLFSFFLQFPWYVQVFYGGLLSYMVIDIASIG